MSQNCHVYSSFTGHVLIRSLDSTSDLAAQRGPSQGHIFSSFIGHVLIHSLAVPVIWQLIRVMFNGAHPMDGLFYYVFLRSFTCYRVMLKKRILENSSIISIRKHNRKEDFVP